MRKLVATVFNYSLDGPAHLDFLHSAYAHVMGRTAYEAISRSMTTTATTTRSPTSSTPGARSSSRGL
jgi:hypothetical protein